MKKIKDVCNQCSKTLIKRSHDEDALIEKRMDHYRKNMEQNYAKAKTFFPYVVLKTKGSMEECITLFNDLWHLFASSKDVSSFLKKVNQHENICNR
jgi:hypothetical protein